MGAILSSLLCPTYKICTRNTCKNFEKNLQVFLVSKELLPLDHQILKPPFLLCSWMELEDFQGFVTRVIRTQRCKHWTAASPFFLEWHQLYILKEMTN